MAKLSNILTARSSQGPSDNFKNIIINGDMQVAQRATSVASLTADGYRTVDRWFNYIVTQGTWTQSVENDAPTGSGFRKSLKMLCTTADASPASGDRLYISQLIEGQNLQHIKKGTAAAEQLTLSFWVKANVTGTYIAELYDNDNTRQVSASYTISSSATWEKKTITFPADTTGAFDNDNAASLELILWLGAGSGITSGTLNTTWASVTAANRAVGQTNLASATSNYWQITGVQLEVGNTATPFEFLPVQQELLMCQRYYQGFKTFFGVKYPSSYVRFDINLPVDMRVAPTVYYKDAVDNVNKISTFNTSDTRTNNRNAIAVGGTTTSTVTVLPVNSDSDAGYQIQIAVEAEL